MSNHPNRSRMNQQEITSAIVAARTAAEADRRNDATARDKAILDLFGAIGYWRTPRTTTTAEFRGERVPPKMLRMPAGARAVSWANRWAAVQAWAAESL